MAQNRVLIKPRDHYESVLQSIYQVMEQATDDPNQVEANIPFTLMMMQLELLLDIRECLLAEALRSGTATAGGGIVLPFK